MTFGAVILPQRPSQSNEIGSTAVALPLRSELAVLGAVFAIAGDSPVVPLPAETDAKPVAHTAPVARPVAPKASQAASRRRVFEFEGLDTALIPFLAVSAGRRGVDPLLRPIGCSFESAGQTGD